MITMKIVKLLVFFVFVLTWNSIASTGEKYTAEMQGHFRSPRDVVNIDHDQGNLTPLSLHIVSKITSRFSNTLVTSTMENSSPKSRVAKFVVQLPQTAFISNFSMEIKGTLYIGVVKERKAAAEEFERAKNNSINAGLVSASNTEPIRGMDVFEIAMNIASNSSAVFRLNYQQLLVRRRGYYEETISIRPKQVVPDLQVDIDIVEPQGLSYVDVMKIRNEPSDVLVKGNPTAAITFPSSGSAHIEYRPNEQEQKSQGSAIGLDGDLVVRYDVEGGNDAGLVQVLGSHFVHYFSPRGLKPLLKNVVFVIDISGSMSGSKIKQTREAMLTIIDQLRENDAFNLVIFNSVAIKWKDGMVRATNASKGEGKSYVLRKVQAEGSTNIYDALLLALKLLHNATDQDSAMIADNFPMIVFLTDGQPTAGETNTPTIRAAVREANLVRASIYALGFGSDVDFNFLEALAIENGGNARKIYPDADAREQLEGFFDEVSTPVLQRMRFEYPNDVIVSALTTETVFPQYYEGSELVVSGKLKDDVTPESVMAVTVRGEADVNPVTYSVSRTIRNLTLPADKVIVKDFTERLWAYQTIKELLRKMLLSRDERERAYLESQALNMSLAYSFVTPLTSFVVVQEDSFLELDDTNLRSGSIPAGDIPSNSPAIGSFLMVALCVTVLSIFVNVVLEM